MKILRDLARIRLKRSSVAIGVFDGVHRGHRAIVAAAKAAARRRDLRLVALTMDPHPSKVLHPDRPEALLCSLEHRLELLKECGVQIAVVLRFNRSLARMPAAVFVQKILREALDARAIFVGNNFRFGRGAQGDAFFLAGQVAEAGCSVTAVRPVCFGQAVISSSRIRAAVTAGRFEAASKLLGRAYGLVGTVVRGDGRGRRFGFPTINLRLDHELLPPAGVYAVWARSGRKTYPGVLHLGPRPTFDSTALRAECHLLRSPSRSLYGSRFELMPVKRLRGVRRFEDPQALWTQIRLDIRAARLALQSPLKRVY